MRTGVYAPVLTGASEGKNSDCRMSTLLRVGIKIPLIMWGNGFRCSMRLIFEIVEILKASYLQQCQMKFVASLYH